MSLRELVLRYRKDPRFIVSVPLVILAATSLIYYITQQAKQLTPDALGNRLLLFVLWNINLLLIVGILFVLLRGVVKLVLNEQIPFSTPDDGLTVNAVHVAVNVLGVVTANVVVASSESDIGNCP